MSSASSDSWICLEDPGFLPWGLMLSLQVKHMDRTSESTVFHSPNLGPRQAGGHMAGEAGTPSWNLFQLCFGTSPIFKNKTKSNGEWEELLNSRSEVSGGMRTRPIVAFFMVKTCHEAKEDSLSKSLSLFPFNST